MDLSEEKEFDLLAKAIEDTSKHARTLLFILVISSIYVLIVAFSKDVDPAFAFNENLSEKERAAKTILTLPVLDVDVQLSVFFTLSPIVLLGMYLYLHIYVLELNTRLQEYDNLKINCQNISSPRLLLFPWLFIFASQSKSKFSLTLVSNTIIWFLGPLVLLALWIRFVRIGGPTSATPCICSIVSFFSIHSDSTFKKISPQISGFLGIWLVLTTIYFNYDIWDVNLIHDLIYELERLLFELPLLGKFSDYIPLAISTLIYSAICFAIFKFTKTMWSTVKKRLPGKF